jgi:Fe-S oxidoreductase
VKNIVTTCPHAYNTLANEYPYLGGFYNVMHYTEYLLQLIKGGRIRCNKALNQRITYHDPCYLSRHNHIIDAPRELLQLMNKQRILEMDRNRRSSFCCGGGGGMSFAEEETAQRVNRFRARQVLDTGAEMLAVACPYCLTMMEDGIKNEQGARSIQVVDIAELIIQVI